ncbi:MAG: MFS transporter [Chloroflexi bacterium]|nr:MFS transporter [Chloroflexota bacterium]
MTPFSRDRLTWLMYFMLASYAFFQAAPGPIMPFLGDELHLSYTVRGFHFSAFASGLVIAGLIGDQIVTMLTRQRAFWLGGVVMMTGAVLLVTGQQAILTITAMFLMGLFGSLILVVVQATLADHHGSRRATALTEANVVASMGASVSPLIIGVVPGWRIAIAVGMLYWTVLAITFRRVKIPRRRSVDDTNTEMGTRRLPSLFWGYWLITVLGVSIEWSIVFWAAEFLENNVGVSKDTAALIIGIYFLTIVTGRILGSALTRQIATPVLQFAAFMIVAIGFVPFWTASSAALSIGGLLFMGFGAANIFPMSLALATGAVGPHQADAASGRISLAAGLAILIAPQILGSLADSVGIVQAYAVVAGLLVVSLVCVVWVNRVSRQAATI